ncbi:unnamed protein product [Notodromas monacha]|uniref:Uncharacterized protein n=1 Tax=Notodromas monacha TaxID=399045 RepID=A0A7R9BN05_9CRUS|nr:unnamed protein product [Notodromas monacha]CAG0918183.1 unnamed protein product [Notodromas monacha]
MQWLRGPTYDSKRELDEMRAHLKLSETDFKVKDLLKENKYVAPMALLLFYQLARQSMGYFNIIGHTVQIFEDAGTDHESAFDPFWATVVNGVGDILAQIVSSVVVETVGRRKPILLSTFLIGIFHVGFAIYMYYWTSTEPADRSEGLISTSRWLPMLSIYGFTFTFCIGMSNVLLVLMGELLPLKIKNFAFSLCFAFNTLCQFLMTKSWNKGLAWLGYHGTFSIYAVAGVITFFVSIWLLPETKGKTLLEIEILLGRQEISRRESLRLREKKSNASTMTPDP